MLSVDRRVLLCAREPQESSHQPPALTCAVFPPPYAGNPYQDLLHTALGELGVSVTAPGALRLRWAVAGHRVDAVHLHWVENLIRSQRSSRLVPKAAFACVRAARLVLSIVALRLRRVPVCWTVHNLRPHEPRHPRLESLTFTLLAWSVSALVVHSEAAARQLVGLRAPRSRVHVLAHGSYIGAYPNAFIDRKQARSDLGIDESSFVYLAFGGIRRYKRIPELISAFKQIGTDGCRLVVAGHVPDAALHRQIKDAAMGDHRVRLHAGFVPEEQVSHYFAAADVAVLNYSEIHSSGALMLALSYGLPVIAPAGGMTDEVAREAAVTFTDDDLASALEKARTCDLGRMQDAAVSRASECTWQNMAASTLALYKGHTHNRSRRSADSPSFRGA